MLALRRPTELMFRGLGFRLLERFGPSAAIVASGVATHALLNLVGVVLAAT